MRARLAALGGRLRARPTLVAALAYALLAFAFVSPAVLTGKVLSNSDSFYFKPPWDAVRPAKLHRPANPEFDDAPAQIQPFVQYTKSRLPHIPLWDPFIDSGRPFLANAQSAVFSPFNVPAYLLPFFSALAWIALAKLFVAAFGAYLLGRTLGMRFGGALLAGTVYAFNLWLLAWLSYPHASVWALIPLLLYLTDRVVRRPDGLSIGGLGTVVGLQFLCGHPESSFHAMLAATAFLALRVAQARSGRVAAGRGWFVAPVGGFVLAAIAGTALAAVAVVPFGELLLHSADVRQRAGTASGSHAPLRYLLGLALPDYWGRPTQTPLEFFLLARAFYAGALPLMLAAVALIARPRGQRLAVALFGAGCMAVVVGIPPIFQVVTHLPIFSGGHNGRLVILYMLGLALLAGWGLDDLTGPRPLARARVAGAAAVAILLAPLVWVVVGHKTSAGALGDALRVAWGFAHPPSSSSSEVGEVIRGATTIVWATVAGAGAALVLLRLRGRLGAATLIVLALGLITVDLFRAGLGYNPAIDRDVAAQPATGAIRYLQTRRPGRFVTVGEQVPQNAIAFHFGLYEARGYDLPVEQRYDRLWRSRLSPEFPSQIGRYPLAIALALPKLDAARLQVLSLLGVTDVLQPRGDPPLGLPGLRLAYDGRDARVYRNERALPRAWIVERQQVVHGGEAALNAVTSPGFDPRGTVVTERSLGLRSGPPAGPAGEVTIERYEPERVVLRTSAARAGLLVLSDNDYPGWNATVDGHDAPVERVDYIFRGVRVPAGAHRVVFRFQPASFMTGAVISLLALLGLAAAALLGWGARRRARRRAPPPSRSALQPAGSPPG